MSDQQTPVATNPLPGSARVDLTDQVIIRVSGAGTDKFLQGQFSQQLADVTEEFSPRAAAATPKGRAYCLSRMVREGEDILMAWPESLAEETLERLRKYLMLFRGTSMNAEPESRVTGLLGASSADALVSGASETLRKDGDSLPIKGGHLVRAMDTGEGLARFELWRTGTLDSDAQAALDALPIDSLATWQASEIAAGVASLTRASLESYVPQMLNWQHLGGVHFKKGCYTGQEVIARMHFLGQLKKSLFRFSLTPEGLPVQPGTALMLNERNIGEVVNAIDLDNGVCEILAVVRHDAADAGVRLKELPEIELTPLQLPYSVTEREAQSNSDT